MWVETAGALPNGPGDYEAESAEMNPRSTSIERGDDLYVTSVWLTVVVDDVMSIMSSRHRHVCKCTVSVIRVVT